MKVLNIGAGALSGALLTAPLMGVLYLAHKLAGLPFVPFDLFDWVARVLPGPVITFGLDLMIDTMLLAGVSVADTAKTAERALAVSQFLLLGVGLGALFFAAMRWRRARPGLEAGSAIGAIVGLPIIAVSISIGGSTVHPTLVVLWLAPMFLACGAVLSWAYNRMNARGRRPEPSRGSVAALRTLDRRQFLIQLGAASATITVASTGLGNLLARAARQELDTGTAVSASVPAQQSVRTPPRAGDGPVAPAPGTRLEVTPVEDHYKVFIRLQPTVIDAADWSLPISGLVDNPLRLTIDDIRHNYKPREQYVTLSCISGRVGTDLISTTHWTGASLQDILADVRPAPEARHLFITSGDGFYETVDLDLIASDRRIMLCYAWEGMPIPIDHGFPLRIWIPDRFGMKQPKWITGIEVMDKYRAGYWVERGWDEVAQVQTTSVIDTVSADAAYESDGATYVPVGGIAFAGARGISKVQVRVDKGPWQEALLRPPLSETTWVIWRYDWPFQAGNHEFEVRCAEKDGIPQIEESRESHPSGARGIHKRRAKL